MSKYVEIIEEVRAPSKETIELARDIAAYFGGRKIPTKEMFELLVPRLAQLEQTIRYNYSMEQWVYGLNGRN